MAKPIAVVVADAHLDHLTWLSRPEIRGDAFFGLEQGVDLAIELGVDLYFAGDNVETLPADSPVDETIWFLAKQVRRVQDAGLRTYWADGQHDTPNWLRATTLREGNADLQVIDNDGVTIGFMSYRRTRDLADAIEIMNQQPCDVVICHQVWKELMGGSTWQGSIKDLKHPKLVISGDFHQYKKVKIKREDKSEIIALSPGSTHSRKINEPQEHYVVILHDDLSTKRVLLRSRVRMDFTIEDEDSFEELYDELPDVLQKAQAISEKRKLPASLTKPLLVVTDLSVVPQAERRLLSVLGKDVHLFYSRTKNFGESDVARQVDGGNEEKPIAMSITQYAREEAGKDEELAAFMTVLLEADTPKLGLKSWLGQPIKREKADVASMG